MTKNRSTARKKAQKIGQREKKIIRRIDKLLAEENYYQKYVRAGLQQSDLRHWRPETDQSLRLLSGRRVSYHQVPARKPFSKPKLTDRIGFTDPYNTPVCIRRKKRRETLFKLRKIGKGKSGPKKRRMSRTSNIRC